MTTMTTTSLPAGQWTLIYTASGAVTVTVQSLTPASDLRIRIGGAVDASADALTAAADILRPFEHRPVTLVAGDKVIACPLQSTITGSINVRA